jgi:hypothetical protein
MASFWNSRNQEDGGFSLDPFLCSQVPDSKRAVTAPELAQCECGRPVPHMPQELGLPVQEGASAASPPLDAKTESFFSSLVEPQSGHGVPFQSADRTRTSLSRSQALQ